MANLAIRGHATRGKEVIEILEMLGGKSYTGLAYKGEDPNRLYCINNENNFIDSPLVLKDVQVFSLEEFLEKFPYKIGDKAFAFGNKCTIIDAVWVRCIDEVVYTIKLDTSKYTTTKLSSQLQHYKEEIMDKASKAVFDANAQCCDIMNHLIKGKTMESVINWRTGKPIGSGKFIITYKYFECFTVYITTAIREGDTWYDTNFDRLRVDVIAWCPLSEIEPYKESKYEHKQM